MVWKRKADLTGTAGTDGAAGPRGAEGAPGTDVILDQGISFAVRDAAGYASWIANDSSGGMPPHSAREVAAKAGPLMASGIGFAADPRLAQIGISAGLVDENGYVAAGAQWDLKGDPTAAMIARIATLIGNQAVQAAGVPGLSTKGDSITQGNQDGSGVTWPQIASDILGVALWNPSVSGEASGDIAIRAGALTPQVSLPGDVIPATTTPVTLTAINPADGYRTLSDGNATGLGVFPGVLCGVAGTLAHLTDGSNSWTFTPKTARSVSTPCPPGSRFYSQDGKAHRNDVSVFWPGRNNPNASQVLRDMATMVAFQGVSPRFLVLGVLNNSAEIKGTAGYNNILSLNAQIGATYPSSYFDMRSWLVQNGLSAAGLTATAQDTADIANDVVPTSLRFDATHPNRFGYLAIGAKVADLIKQKGWATR
ncbi:hypothetical protein [Curtobacterium sp. CFBP9011]|uniref:hypothetical protein n=1 Tax=Curtobacterium sp. CFBP9011 TaxID=3096530 RepID=UPI002A6ABAB2|nr:hypothetical protein [Curtobacterium sp. CFBP9011]MDY1005758.1 hypothetical protein [Curtobacterium sp. CFBP9011]